MFGFTIVNFVVIFQKDLQDHVRVLSIFHYLQMQSSALDHFQLAPFNMRNILQVFVILVLEMFISAAKKKKKKLVNFMFTERFHLTAELDKSIFFLTMTIFFFYLHSPSHVIVSN